MIFLSWTSPFDYKVAPPYNIPMADAIRCLLVIYSQNHVANPGINGNMIGDGFPPQWEPFPSSIVKLTLVQFSTDDTCAVIHPITETLQWVYGPIWYTGQFLTMAFVVNPRIDSMENLSTGQFLLANERLGLVHCRVLPQCSLPTSYDIQVCLKTGGIMRDNSIPFHKGEN